MAACENDMCNTSFWQEIERLTAQLRRESHARKITKATNDLTAGSLTGLTQVSRAEVMEKIESFIEDMIISLSQNQSPVIRYKNRNAWSNMSFNHVVGVEMREDASETTVRLDSVGSIQKFAVTMKILSIAYKLLQEDSYSTKRDIYYNDVSFFGSQTVVDQAVDNISCLLAVPRYSLHILACSKGYMVGQVTFREAGGNYVDCSTMGHLIPSNVQGIHDITSNAKAILVVEKDATYQKLLDGDILRKLYPIIMITGKGFPDINTRLMVRKLWDTLEVPVLALVDADPHGIEIMCVYRFGSRSLSFEADSLTVPTLRWIGVLPSDLQRLPINQEVHIPLTDQDRRKIEILLQRPYITAYPSIQQEKSIVLTVDNHGNLLEVHHSSRAGYRHWFQVMLDSNSKAEMQALSTISTSFLVDVYLPAKIKHGVCI